MTLLSPWALVGLIAIAAPIAAHLLARRPPKVLRFPNLRFLPPTYSVPVRRDRLADVPLLILRIVIVAVAVVALAQPLWLTPGRTRELGSQIARAVIVDSSASMTRRSGAGGTALDAAQSQASEAAGGATISRIVESSSPADLFPSAAAWVLAQPMRRELVVISDFQTSTIRRAQLDRVPAGIGVRIIRVPAEGSMPASRPLARELELLAGPAERDLAAAALGAAVGRGAPARLADDRPVAIVFPSFETYAPMRKAVTLPEARWMAELSAAVSRDALVVAAARASGRTAIEVLSTSADPVNRERFLILVDAPPQSVMAAAVISAVLRHASPSREGESIEATHSDEELRRWERPASDVPDVDQSRTGDWSDGNWVWAAVLLFLVVEWLVRRRRPAIAMPEEHARVA